MSETPPPFPKPLSQWRNTQGFGRPEQVAPGVWATIGPDEETHAMLCLFIDTQGIQPCSCVSTRDRFSWWWQCWFRWLTVRTYPSTTISPLPWPVEGPDREAWVPGVDFSD